MSSFNESGDLIVEDGTGLGAGTGLDGGDAEAGIAGGDGRTARRRGTRPGPCFTNRTYPFVGALS